MHNNSKDKETMIANPFILRGYVSDEYFCDRDKETADLMTEIKNGNNVTLIAPRRIGKMGLVQRMFAQEEIKQKYYTFLVDIYATKTLQPIDKEVYADFASCLFGERRIKREVIYQIYDRFDGITWYLQRMMNKIYSLTLPGQEADEQTMQQALDTIIDESAFAYQALLFQLPAKQKELLLAICHAGKARSIMSATFIKRHHLPSASFVQGGIKGLLEKDFVTEMDGTYELYDKFFGEWLKRGE